MRALVSLSVVLTSIALAPTPDLADIPSAAVEPTDIVKEIVRLSERIEDPQERFRTLSSVLYRLEPLSPGQRQPVLDVLVATAQHVDDQTRISAREPLILHAPETALQIADEIGPPARDVYLSELVGRYVEDQPERARQLLEQIEQREHRYKALVAYAQAAPLDYPQITSLLAEAAALYGRSWPNQRAHDFSNALVRFAGERPDEVARFVTEHLKVHESLLVSLRMAETLSLRHEAPEAAERLVKHAKALIPETKDPARSAIEVIRHGHRQLEQTEAGELFDEFVLPAIVRGEQATDYPLSLLARIDMELLVCRAKVTSEAVEKPLTEVLPGATRRAARPVPDRVLDWLQSQPPGPLRAACMVSIASGLRRKVGDPGVIEESVRQWIGSLSGLAASVENREVQLRVLGSALDMAEDAGLPAQELRQQWREKWKQQEEPRAGHERSPSRFSWLPLDEQTQQIQARLEPGHENHWKHEEHPPWRTLELINRSSLPDAQKQRWYRKLAEQAEAPLAKAATAKYQATHDYPAALKLMWSSLPAERAQRVTRRDVVPPVHEPKNSTEALTWLRDSWKSYLQRDEADEVIEALWAHAQTVRQTDRDAVLAELARVLLEDTQYEKALAVAREIEDLPQRLKLMARAARDADSGAAESSNAERSNSDH